ncbi:predicted protein [Pyrenophora tritici-repentis Pt-1C-BFP]|uniref:Uncharacterized protein n=1 Tax=Pyrenophora tritici-repentis (strain Pt-1C-BFP) TaxID=426418 RepID=B2W522_PYRTR|nr:uncharacterized protein PTRG_04722 [Pyrenophora tritici-repentis Pt-1C-BFP]EDU47629.1 predicted protein [Pyrenophora tritici-repentis Pt-1C-BFP]
MAPDSDTIVVQLPEDLRTPSILEDEMETEERHQDNPTTPIEQTTQETPRDFTELGRVTQQMTEKFTAQLACQTATLTSAS